MSTPLVIFLHSPAYDRVWQAANLLLTASSMGRPCHLFLFYGALDVWVRGEIDNPGAAEGDRLRRAFELHDGPDPSEVFEMARGEAGGLTVTACSASMRILGLEPAQVEKRVDRVAGLAWMLETAAGAQVLYI